MKRLQHIAFGIIGGVSGWLLFEWMQRHIALYWISLIGALFAAFGPSALLLWLGLRARRFYKAALNEGRFPPSGWEERYGAPTFDPGAVEMKAKEAALAAKVFLLMGVIWLVGAAYIAYGA